jgi:DNA-binding IclR family transcriptional regulator
MASESLVALSSRQRDLLEAFLFLANSKGFSPSIGEVAARLQVSKTRAYQLAQACISRGYLEQNHGTARSWRLSPAGMDAIAHESA